MKAPTDPVDFRGLNDEVAAPTEPRETPIDPQEVSIAPLKVTTAPSGAPTDPLEHPTDPLEASIDSVTAPTNLEQYYITVLNIENAV